MSTIWQILGITPTEDVRIIKKAYASLIKKNRPDEHPEAFQEIQNAYQQALNQVSAALIATKVQPLAQAEAHESSGSALAQPHREDLKPADSSEEQLKHSLYNHNVGRIRQLLNCPASEINNTHAWAFLTESDFIYDGEYNFFLGVATLQLLHAYLGTPQSDSMQSQWEIPPPRSISRVVWHHLATIFNWAMRGNYLQSHLEPEEMRLLVKEGILEDIYLPRTERPTHSPAPLAESRSLIKVYVLAALFLAFILFTGYSFTLNPPELKPNRETNSLRVPPPPNSPPQKTHSAATPVATTSANAYFYLRIDVNSDFVEGGVDIEAADYTYISNDGVGIEFLVDKNYRILNVEIYSSCGDVWLDKRIASNAKYWQIKAGSLGEIKTPIKKRLYLQLKNQGKRVFK